MVIGLVASPFIAVPPPSYGRTELCIANMAEGLKRRGHQVIVYANGESKVGVEVCWIYGAADASNSDFVTQNEKEMRHLAWAIQDAAESCEIVHINNSLGIPYSSHVSSPVVLTLSEAHDPDTSDLYSRYPNVHYVCNSLFRAQQETMPSIHVINYGLDLAQYPLCRGKKWYLSFVGRISPAKGTHLAIAVAIKAGIPLKIAGPVRTADEEYFNAVIKPRIDGSFVAYLGEVNQRTKNELLGESLALLFPTQRIEPFGLVMAEAMACGTPVLAFRGGAVEETVKDGTNGNICSSLEDMALRAHAAATAFSPREIRTYAEEHFSMQRMAESYEALYSEITEKVAIRTARRKPPGTTNAVFKIADYLPTHGLPSKGCSSARKLILCIDDSIEQLQLERAILQLKGYDVLTATSGLAGLELLKQNFIDVVLVDYCMPEMNGGDVALEVRRIDPTIPIVVVSGSDTSSMPEVLFELVNGFVPKGSPPDVLLSVLSYLTRQPTALAS